MLLAKWLGSVRGSFAETASMLYRHDVILLPLVFGALMGVSADVFAVLTCYAFVLYSLDAILSYRGATIGGMMLMIVTATRNSLRSMLTRGRRASGSISVRRLAIIAFVKYESLAHPIDRNAVRKAMIETTREQGDDQL